MNPGKRFEKKFGDSVEGSGLVVRIPDKLIAKGNRIISEESEADFLVFFNDDSFMVECKAVNRNYLQFYNVKEHQEDSLSRFDSFSAKTHGILAVEFYDKAGYRKPKRMFLLTIDEWMLYKESSGRKSMPIRDFEALGIECPYVKGKYVIDLGSWCQ